jgi:tartrate-resistant acid phosphatase type 5
MVNARLVFLLLAALLIPTTGAAQHSVTSTRVIRPAVAYDGGSVDLLGELPLTLRAAGSAILSEPDDKGRARLAENLAENHPDESMDFLIALLDREKSALVRAEIVSELGARRHPNVLRALERRIDSGVEESDEVAGLAFRALIRNNLYSLPGPLSLGSLVTDNSGVRVLVFGDFGSGSKAQRELASDMDVYHKQNPFDFGITVGDNFYPSGLSSPVHRRWQSQWENLYTPLGIQFYATLGNHDTGDPASPYAQVLRTKRSASWRMPARFYTFTAGPAQFFAIDTNKGRLSDKQLAWLEDELKKSTASWKIVYGHHPFKSDGEHGDDTYTRKVRNLLLPVLKAGGADLYLAGHDHDMQHLKPEGDLHLFISGGGGKGHRSLRPLYNRLWGRSTYGFTVLDVAKDKLLVEFVAGRKRICAVEISKGGAAKADCP